MRASATSSTDRCATHANLARGMRAGPALLLGALLLAAIAPQAARAGCVTRLPVQVTLPDGAYAAAYSKEIRVRVVPRVPRVRNLRAELYTFGGKRMADGPPRAGVRAGATLTLRLDRLFRPLQAGAFTLVLSGEPNASRSCGPKKTTRVLRFRACTQTLPVTFPGLPGGVAADYGSYLSVAVRSEGPLIRDVRSSIYGFDGSLLGRAPPLAALFGQQTLDHPLAQPLLPGRYTVVVDGLIDDQPPSCGRKAAQATMTFG